MQKIFGTDGVRGIYGQDITPRLANDMGRAVATYLKQNNKHTILIAKDTRASGDILITAFASGAMARGVNVIYMGLTTTPALSYTTKVCNFGAGIMVTASHNAVEYNGIKIFKSSGEKLSAEDESALINIYENIDKESNACGTLSIRYHLSSKYINYLKKLLKGKYFDYSVAFDCANGVTYKILRGLLDNHFKKVYLINTSFNAQSVNVNCGATDTLSLAQFVVDNRLDFGFAFDGDGDRVIMVDSNGDELDGDDILYNLAIYLKKQNKLKNNAVVGTIMANLGLEKALIMQGVTLLRENVGDKYIIDRLIKDDLSLGGEKAGHIIPYAYTNTGDGILTSIVLLTVMQKSKLVKVKKYPQENISLEVTKASKQAFATNKLIEDYLQKVIEQNSDCRFVVRASGTENKIRIMVEGEEKSKVFALAHQIKDYIQYTL